MSLASALLSAASSTGAPGAGPGASASASAAVQSRGISFVAPDIGTAIADIRAKLGSEAVILDIRRSPANGLRRFWQKPHIEVVACLPEAAPAGLSSAPVPAEPAFEEPPVPAGPSGPSGPSRPSAGPMRVRIPQQHVLQRYARASVASEPETPAGNRWPDAVPAPVEESAAVLAEPVRPNGAASEWRSAAIFDRLGFNPLHTEQVILRMREIRGRDRPAPESLPQELGLARDALRQLWRPASELGGSAEAPLHVFLGPPGSGKSTALCKWLAQTVLVEGRPARAWRLDGRTTNASELVSLYGEILGVRVERSWNGRPEGVEVGFVDLAGADFQDTEAVDGLGETLARLRGAVVHLVLNAAYTVPLLLAQARAFSRLPVDDLILTHLDEEAGWGKLWNLVMGTKYPISRLSAGQNIPGRFLTARPELLAGSLFGL